MPILTLRNIFLSFGLNPLLDHVDFDLESKERVCIIGRNGAGKSTFLKLLMGEIEPDSGEIWRRQGLQITKLAQELPEETDRSVYEVVASGLGTIGDLISEYYTCTRELAQDSTPGNISRLQHCQQQLESRNGWMLEQRVQTILSLLNLPGDQSLKQLSGGWQRRVLLGRALVGDPDILLLDEPTNHLDIEQITWLEKQIDLFKGTVVFITHDRRFLRNTATRLIELDRGQLTSWPGNYENFLRRQEERRHAESRINERFDKKLAEEEQWIRQGIQARRTRNEGRVRALKQLRDERQHRREAVGKVRFEVDEGLLSGKLVVRAEEVSKQMEGKTLVQNFNFTFMRGDRVGLIGPNGVGKTTLVKMLLDQIPTDSGKIVRGTKLSIGYFDQNRVQLDPEKTVMDSVADGRTHITVNDRERHLLSYLRDFLFSPQRARSPVKTLSGGEKNRLLLARLFAKPANLLVMDEPTNDLDMETLELLEEILSRYQGSLLLVSHDREFVDNVVTSILAFEGQGIIREYIGGYQDWLRQRPDTDVDRQIKSKSADGSSVKEIRRSPAKLGFNQQRELKELPGKIEQLEMEIETIQNETSHPAFYKKQSPEQIEQVLSRLGDLEQELSIAYDRWESLESLEK